MIGGGNGGKPGSAPMPAGFPRKIDFHCEAGRWGTPAAPKMGENGGEKTVGKRWSTVENLPLRTALPLQKFSPSFPRVFHSVFHQTKSPKKDSYA